MFGRYEEAIGGLLVMSSVEFKPCPFCGTIPELPTPEEVLGTWFEWSCACGVASFSDQICNYMTTEERISEEVKNFFREHTRFPDKYILRVTEDFKGVWNTRYE